MGLLHKIWRVFVFQIGRIFTTPRIPLIFILLGIYIYSTVEPVADFCRDVHIAATPWIFPHLTNDYVCQMVFMVGVIFLFCDAPFTDESYLYIISRSGRTAWAGGHVLYIVILSLCYVFYMAVIGIVPLLGNLQFSMQWGKILGTLARTNAASQYGLTFSVSNYLTGVFLPVQAMLISFLLEWACISWLGFVIYFFNTITRKMVGTFLSAVFVMLDIMIYNEWTPGAYAFSPITLAQLSSLVGINQRYGITLNYSIQFFVVSLSILVVLCMVSGHFEKCNQRFQEKLKNCCKRGRGI
ncbi:MAG: hypothetical protein ACFWTN_00115 [Clostridium sp.]|jgi:hypothetical protein